MGELHLILFTLLWTLVWIAPVPRLSPRVELVAGLIPFAAFGLRVFAGFFTGVPETDPVRTAVSPLLNWVAGTAGAVPYAVVLDATVALGLVWFAAAFDIPRKSRITTAWIMPAVAIASLASLRLAGQPLEELLASHLPPALLAGLLGGMIAAVIALTPSDIPNTIRRRAAGVALVATPLAAGLGAAVLGLLGTLPAERQAAAASIAALATGVVAGLVALLTCGFTRQRSRWLFAMAIGVAAGATVGQAAAADTADTLFSGGEILTMRGPAPEYVESLAVKDGKIVFAGPLAEGRKLVGPATKTVDLGGKTLLPGFIDTHGHFVYFGKNLVDANLFGCADVADLVARMKKQAERTPADGWIVGFGYQARGMKEGRPPTSAELDQISADRPVMVVDSSGHLGAANAAAFKAAGITAATPDPTGGQFTRGPDGTSLLGPMEETALNAVRSKRPPFTGELAARAITGAAEVWASHGQTTAMEAGLGLGNDDIGIVLEAIDKKLLSIDLYVAAKDSALDDTLAAAYSVGSQYNPQAGGIVEKLRAARPDLDRRYVNRVRLGGVKFWLDGSLDTAWFTQPYTQNPPGKSGAFAGYRQIPDETLDAVFDKYWPTELQIHMHMNGDAAADQALSAIAKAVKKHGMHDHRPVFVHATWLRPDQIEKMKTCGAIPSFLTGGIIPGGDAVVKLWGPERSAGAMASRTFLRAGLPFTYSHDAPVSPVPSILALVDAGVNRLSGTGKVVGPDERIAPYDALRAVTSTAAYQLKEETSKGTLEPGKLADLVILDRNPLKVEPTTIKDIAVVETIKEGRTVYAR